VLMLSRSLSGLTVAFCSLASESLFQPNVREKLRIESQFKDSYSRKE
jgi:hypothetical protein